MTGWQTIDTAPKDGTTIDVWRDGSRETVYWGFPPHCCGEMGQHCDSDWHSLKEPGWICSTFGEYVGGQHDPFTHWMPIPSGPGENDGGTLSVSVPLDVRDQVLAMGRVEWGATAEKDDAGHIAGFANTLRLTREHFGFDDIPVAMHCLCLEGTETILCHTGTSPNSGPNAQALTGAWNWLHDVCAGIVIQGEGGAA